MVDEFTERYFVRKISAFTEALGHAIYDRDLEDSGRDIHYYYDSEVAIWLILGFEAETVQAREDIRARLVHALLWTGYLGKVRVLHPHALEVYSKIKRQSQFGTTEATGAFRERLREYVEQRGLTEIIRNIVAAVRDLPADMKTQVLVDEFRSNGPEAFATIALATGTWQERLGHLHGRTIVFEEEPADAVLPSASDRRDIRTFHRAITEHRDKATATRNNLADAIAMGSLSRMIRQGEGDERTPFVRFYTTTKTLLHLRSDPGAARYLRYRSGRNSEAAATASSIFRSTDYYMLRAHFDALGFKVSELQKRDPIPLISIDELRSVHQSLRDVLRETDLPESVDYERETELALRQKVDDLKIGGQNLTTVLAEIECAAFVDNIFTQFLNRYRTPKTLRHVVKDFDEIWQNFDTDLASRVLRKEIRDRAENITQQLAKKVAGVRLQLDFIRKVYLAATKFIKDNSLTDVPDPLRELGLVRWDSQITDDAREKLRAFSEGLLLEQDDNSQLVENCVDLFRQWLYPDDEAACIAVCSLLWTLNLFPFVIEAINRYELRCDGGLPTRLKIMRMAARMRTGAEKRGPVEDEQAFDELVSEVEQLRGVPDADERRGRQYIGLGYIAFYIWWDLTMRFGTEDEFVSKWATRSVQYGIDAMELLRNDVMARAFAVNHCAFVSLKAGFTDVEKYVKMLQQYDGADIWNYRFADTIAMNSFEWAEKRWNEVKKSTSEWAKAKDELRIALETAWKLLDDNQPYFGDREIATHKNQIRDLARDIGCADIIAAASQQRIRQTAV